MGAQVVASKRAFVVVVVLALLVVCATTGFAQDDDQIYKTLSKSQLLSIMQEEGYSATDDDEQRILWTIEGNPAFFIFYDDIDDMALFWAGVESEDTTLHHVNEWNKNNRYIRTYIDDEGDPIMEMDLDVEGGVTREWITSFLRTCRQSYVSWYDDCVK